MAQLYMIRTGRDMDKYSQTGTDKNIQVQTGRTWANRDRQGHRYRPGQTWTDMDRHGHTGTDRDKKGQTWTDRDRWGHTGTGREEQGQ